MATGADLVASARTRLDWNYEVDSHRLIGDTRTTDCSGFVFLAAKDCGIRAPTVSWTQARWCHDAGLDGIPIADALQIVGALLFKGANMGFDGFGAEGHVAITMGDGVNVIEAEGHARDILIDPALGEGHPWSNAARMPGLDYGTTTEDDMPLNAADIEAIRQIVKQTIEAAIGGGSLTPPDPHATVVDVVKHYVK